MNSDCPLRLLVGASSPQKSGDIGLREIVDQELIERMCVLKW